MINFSKFVFIGFPTPTFKCKICGAPHGDIDGDNVCPDCRTKGY